MEGINVYCFDKVTLLLFGRRSKEDEASSTFSTCGEGRGEVYHPSTHANINGATIVASLSTINFGVLISSLPQVIFSFGTAPE